MIKIDVKLPSQADLMRAVMAEAKKQIAQKAKAAAARHGGVTVQFTRKPGVGMRTVELQGSEAAIEAVRAAIAS